MSRIHVVCLATVVCCLPAASDPEPTDEQVESALETLDADLREGAQRAVDVLVRDGSRNSLKAVVDFGARTAFTRHAILAGEALAAHDPGTAAKLVHKTLRHHRKNPRGLANLALMAEHVPGGDGYRLLIGLAKDRRPLVAATAIRALGARAEEDARSTLLHLVKSNRPVVAAATATALSRLKTDEATMELLFKRAQRSGRERVGDACALALARIEGAEPYGNRALELCMGRSSHDSFHALAKLALRLAKKPDPELLERALRSPASSVRELACDIIGLTKTGGFQDQLLRMASSEHGWRNQVAAWLALRRAGCGEVLDGIEASIAKRGEPSYWALQCAIKNPSPALLPALRDAALDAKDPVRRELAQIALRKVARSKDATRAFFVDTWKRRRGARSSQAALLGLGNLKDAESFHALVALLEAEKDRKYRLWILKGLEKLTGHYYKPDPEIWKDWFRVVEGHVAFVPEPIDRKKNRERVKKIEDLGISPRTEAAVEYGLAWLKRHQDISGGWNGATYHKNCTFHDDCGAEGGIRERPLAYTGLALLAFQGAGYSHLEGPYRDVMQRGWEYLLAHQDYDGSHNEKTWTFSYEAAIVCQALCDGYGLTGDPWLGEAAQRMLDYLVKIQYPGRTWRYRVRSSETDTSVMSWILTACIAARHAGLDMPEQIFVASEVWLNRAQDPIPPDTFEIFVPDQFKKDNRYFHDVSRDEKGQIRHYKIKTWYQPPRLYTPAMSAIGVLARIWLGWTRAHPFCVGGANQVMSQVPGYDRGLEGEFAFYPYTWYYGSLAMYQMGGRYWSRWRDQCLTDVIQHQRLAGCQHGSWAMPRGQLAAGLTGGTVYCTAMAILALESFYRYQPYLARFELRSREETEAEDDPAPKKPVKPAGKK